MAKQNHGQAHLHLTNCVHLRNYRHMQQRQSPNPATNHLMRDLALLQRSRSLRDPSTSPPSWFSPSELNKQNGVRSEIGRKLESIADLEELEVGSGRKKKKKKKRGKALRANRVHTVQPVCSNSSVNYSSSQNAMFGNKAREESEFGNGDLEFLEDSRNVCGIPFNWSRIHDKGKSFLSCGLSDSKGSKFDGSNSQIHAKYANSRGLNRNLNSCTSSDSIISPFFVESGANSYLKSRFSGELGIFSNQSFEIESDSDLGLNSEAKSGFNSRNRRKSLTLTQKYAPKSFKDIIAQTLVVQALSNAIIKRKIGLIYLFHGSQGTGKSSIALIFAKSLNCTSINQNKPCDSCDSCISHNNGKNKNIIQFGVINSEKIREILQNFNIISSVSSQYKILIFDECDSLKPDTWAHINKSIENSTRKMVFIFITNNNTNNNLPHGILSKSQKFFFPKIKEAEIANYLNFVCNNEGLNVDKNGLKLIASKSDGSLRDGLMILDQLSLLGQRIDLSTVQELIGAVSEEKLMDLLDPALSGRTANTVRTLREILETGVDPTALMSQLATFITDVLAGAAPLAGREAAPRRHRLFFRHDRLGREETERLRQALKVLSEAEKQLRASNDKITWLTASLLQLAPDKFYTNPTPISSSKRIEEREIVEEEEEDARVLRSGSRNESETGRKMKERVGLGERNGSRNESETGRKMKERVGLGERNGSRNESETGRKMKERVGLGERNGSRNESETGQKMKMGLGLGERNGSRNESETGRKMKMGLGLGERNGSRNESETGRKMKMGLGLGERNGSRSERGKVGVGERNGSRSERETGETGRNMSLVRGKVSLAQVINRFEGSSGGWSRQKAISIAEKLEKQNLRLESRSRRLFCWRVPRVSKAKMQKLKIRVLKRNFAICTRGCLCAKEKSP